MSAKSLISLERVTRFERATPTLARSRFALHSAVFLTIPHRTHHERDEILRSLRHHNVTKGGV